MADQVGKNSEQPAVAYVGTWRYRKFRSILIGLGIFLLGAAFIVLATAAK